jgi:NADPH-dependent 2,4-dienoyl-CoA reductase/sulfur reductase-like enzyme
MADSYWKSNPSSNSPSSTFITGMPTMFAQPQYGAKLNTIRQGKGISGLFNHNLVEVRPDDKVAVFEVLAGEDKGKKVEKEFGMMHVTPPMGPLDWVKNSALADSVGWVEVDQGTLQHKRFENVFSLGDASSLPTSKVCFSSHLHLPIHYADLDLM